MSPDPMLRCACLDMSEIAERRLDYDASDVHLRYVEARRIAPQTMAMWLDAIERHVPPWPTSDL